ncbi:MAG: hypothetical protein H0X02_10965 [Nitrosomonas sp.]|nr:hypothetical protein [Nitrosomonas sp.]
MNVSHDQLKYWRRNGLLPKPLLRGLGRGMGIEQLWNEECIKNVRSILESAGGKRINLKSAGRYLFARNRPISEFLLQRSLLEIPHEMREKAKQRIECSLTFTAHVELMRCLTPKAVINAITQTKMSTLTELYNRTNKADTQLGAQVALISNCHNVFDVLVETEFPDITGMNALSNEALYRRQRSFVAWAVLIHYYGDNLFKMAGNAIQQIVLHSMSSEGVQPIIWPKN